MKKVYSLLAVLICLFSIVKSQNPNFLWAKQIGNTGNDLGKDIAIDGSGNVYTAGYFNGTVDFDPGAGVFNLTSAGQFDFFISKLDASGNFVWARRMGSTGNDQVQSIFVDGSGNVYTTGYFQVTVDFDPGAGTFNLTSAGGDDIFIHKLDASGNFIWAKRIGGTSSDAGTSISIDGSGNVLTTGYFFGTVDFDPGAGTFNIISSGVSDVFISKLDASGNFVWAKNIGGSLDEQSWSIANDGAGNVYTTGWFEGTPDFDPGAGTFTLTSAGQGDIFISKLDALGNFIWAKSIGATTNDVGISNAVDGSGNVYTTGTFNGTVDFDPGASVFNLASAGGTDIFISKLDASGNFVWAKSMGATANDASQSISIDSWGYVYTTGYFDLTVDFNPGAGVFNLASVGSQDIFISKLDASGNFVWAASMGGTGIETSTSIVLNSVGNIYITGRFAGTVDFDPGAGTFNLGSAGSNDVFIAKYCQTPEQAIAISGSTSICAGSSPIYTLNPLPGATTYTWVLPGGWSGAGTSNTINPATGSSGTITVSGVNACGTGISQTIAITVNPLPTITVNSGSICSGNSFTMAPSGANTYTFQGGSSTVSPTTTTSYTVSGTSAAGCVSAGPAISNVTVNATPTVAVNSGSICNGQNFTMTPSGASTYTFQGGSASVSPTTTTSYTVSGTSTAGCVSSSFATSNVTVNALPAISVNSGSICNGQSFTMSPSGASTYTFSSGPVVSPTITSSYSVTGTSTAGCVSASAAISNVTVNALPVITVNSGSICSGNSFTMVPGGASTYTFQGGNAVVSPTTNTSYTVTGTSTAGCVSSSPATSNVTVSATPTINVAGGAICPGGSFTFNPTGANTYTYSGGQIVSPGVTTTYSISGTSTAGCVSQIALATVTVANNLTVTISGNNTVCAGSSINLTAGGAASYTWNTGATTTTIAPTPTASTTYSVLGTSGSCSNTAQVSVTVNPLPTLSLTTSNAAGICLGQTATLTVSGANTYSWSTGATTNTIAVSPTVTTAYTVTGTNANGCSTTSVLTQIAVDCTDINELSANHSSFNVYPNPFNNKITIVAGGAKQSIIQVYNTLGSLIYSSEIKESKTEIDLSEVNSGIYFIRIGTVTRKIIKE